MRSLVQLVPWSVLDRLAAERGADAGARRPSTRSQLVAPPYGQLAGAGPPRGIEAALASHREGRLRPPGARPVARSTLAGANAERPAAAFAGLPGAPVARARRGLRREPADVVRPIDSAGLRLAGRGAERARSSAGVRGAEAHVAPDPDAARPVHLAVAPARVGDIAARPPRRCRWSPGPPASSTRATMTTAGGRGSTPGAAGSWPG